jgi:hypothetical protein
MSRNPISVLVHFSLFLLLPGCAPDDNYLFFRDVPYPSQAERRIEQVHMELVAEYGDRDSGLVFGRILTLAVSGAGHLAVYDRDECRIWLVDRVRGGHEVLGGCGDGPGEFRYVTALAFSGDTILAFDTDRRALVRLRMDGTEISRTDLGLEKIGAKEIVSISPQFGMGMALGLKLYPNGMTQEDTQLVLSNSAGDSLNSRGLLAPPIARGTPRQIVRSVSSCTGDSEDTGHVWVVANHWGPQVVTLGMEDFEPLASVRMPVEWAVAHEHSLIEGHWGPMISEPGLACGSDLFLVTYRDQRKVSGETVVSGAALFAMDYAGNILYEMRADHAPDAGSVLFLTPGAASGDRFFLFSNNFLEFPTIREYRVSRGPVTK